MDRPSPADRIPFVDLRAQHRGLETEIVAAIRQVVTDGNFILGSQVQEFENAFAAFVGVAHAVGVSSGLDALRLSLLALGVGYGDEVIIPANTYIATALAVSSVGARPVFVDCDPRTYSIDPTGIEAAITSRTRALIPVHLTGQAADMSAILALAEQYDLRVIEDAAQAPGAVYKGKPCGSLGTLGCFSFYPSKNLGACGDGGMITVHDTSLAEQLAQIRNYGQKTKNEHITKRGLNARLDTLQAAVLQVKLRYVSRWNTARWTHAQQYIERLAGLGDIVTQARLPHSSHVYHLFIIETDQRDALQQYLERCGIENGIHYPIPIHLQPAFADLGYRPGDFPCAERLSRRMLSLPMFPELTQAQIDHVVAAVRNFYDRCS